MDFHICIYESENKKSGSIQLLSQLHIDRIDYDVFDGDTVQIGFKKALLHAIKHRLNSFIFLYADTVICNRFKTVFPKWCQSIPTDWNVILSANGVRSEHLDIKYMTFIGINSRIYLEILKLYESDTIQKNNLKKSKDIFSQIFEKYPNFVEDDGSLMTQGVDRLSKAVERYSLNIKELKLGKFPTINQSPYKLPLVTVIICAFNAESTIKDAVMSIVNSTYKAVEVIIVDDCSTDATYSMANSIAEDDPRITLIKNDTNVGCYASRNNALKIATGKFITFQDADDYSLSSRISEQLYALLRYKVLFSSCMIIRSHLINFDFLADTTSSADLSLMAEVEKKRIHSGKHCCKKILGMVTPLFQRKVFEECGFYLELRCIADAEFCERVLYKYGGIKFKEGESVVTYLSENNQIPELYFKLDKVLYISREMNSLNITSKYRDKKDYLQSLVNNWRRRTYGSP